MKRQIIVFYGLNILIPLMAGSLCYLSLRPDTYLSQAVYEVLGFEPDPIALQSFLPHGLQIFFRNHMCDILWAYALTFSIFAVWTDETSHMYPKVLLAVVFEAGIEFMQRIGILSGTFDIWDIFLEIGTTALAALLIKKHETTKENWK